MVAVPSNLNGVRVEFAPAVTNDVTQRMLEALEFCIRPNIVPGMTLERIWISSLRDSHICPSRHVTGNACDISRLNGLHISMHYSSNQQVRAMTDGLQNRFEQYQHRRENFGPTIKLKEGAQPPSNPGPHNDHFHWSVNGSHVCPTSLLTRSFHWLHGLFRRRSEVCNHSSD